MSERGDAQYAEWRGQWREACAEQRAARKDPERYRKSEERLAELFEANKHLRD